MNGPVHEDESDVVVECPLDKLGMNNNFADVPNTLMRRFLPSIMVTKYQPNSLRINPG